MLLARCFANGHIVTREGISNKEKRECMDTSKMPLTLILVTYTVGDVTGDGVEDYIYITALQKEHSPYLYHITLFVQDGLTGAVTRTVLPESQGYDPSVFLGDFTGNQVKDIFISVATGGSGAIYNHYVYQYTSSMPQLIFNSAVYNEQYQYEVTYQDNYKVAFLSKYNGMYYVIDISTRDPSYLNEIYDSNGVLKQPISGFVNPLSGMYPVDFDYNGVYELLGFQRIAGRYNADALGYVNNVVGWKNNQFILQNQYLDIFGSNE